MSEMEEGIGGRLRLRSNGDGVAGLDEPLKARMDWPLAP